MSLPICEHVKLDGSRCGSPALRGRKYCHFHHGTHALVPQTNLFVRSWNPCAEADTHASYQLPYLDDPTAIQIGFMQFVHGVATGLIDGRRGQIMLASLYGAAANLREMNKAAARAKAAQATIRKLAPNESEPLQSRLKGAHFGQTKMGH